MRFVFSSFLLICFYISSFSQKNQSIESGKFWLDTDGKRIEAHAGGITIVNDTYYWYGQDQSQGSGNEVGISCYSSKDLTTWKNEGVVFPASELPEIYRGAEGRCERPKVIYNAKTRKYVMWSHLEAKNRTMGMAGIATSDTPNGKFKFIGQIRPVKFDYGYTGNPVLRERELGNAFRDMNLFLENDTTAYAIYTSEGNASMYCVRLNDTFTNAKEGYVKGTDWNRISYRRHREAPAMFKHKNQYVLFTSGETGYCPNPTEYSISTDILNNWELIGDPCFGPNANTSFFSQSTCVIPAPGKPVGCYIFTADRWNCSNELWNSTYVWLPFVIRDNKIIRLQFLDKWDLSIFDKNPNSLATPQLIKNKKQILKWKPVAEAAFYTIYKNGKNIGSTTATQFKIPTELAGKCYLYTVMAETLYGVKSKLSAGLTINWNKIEKTFLSDIEPEFSKQGYRCLTMDKSVDVTPIKIGRQEFKKGLGSHSYGEIIYHISAKYSRFTASVGIDDAVFGNTQSSAQFEVWGDGVLLYKSAIKKANDKAEFVSVDIKGINELKLVVSDGGDLPEYDHADWADAVLLP